MVTMSRMSEGPNTLRRTRSLSVLSKSVPTCLEFSSIQALGMVNGASKDYGSFEKARFLLNTHNSNDHQPMNYSSIDDNYLQTRPLLTSSACSTANQNSWCVSPTLNVLESPPSLNSDSPAFNPQTTLTNGSVSNCDAHHTKHVQATCNGRVLHNSAHNGASGNPVCINVGVPVALRFPEEKLKTLFALIWMMFTFLFTLVSLAVTHERVPDTEPLPDIFLDNLPTAEWALAISEVIIIISVLTACLIVFLHSHRFIVFRRVFLIMGFLYMLRSILFFVTVLPKPDINYPCAPKAGYLSISLIISRVLKLFSGFGLSINGQHIYCGDYIYSGHTVILTISYLVICEYTPRQWWVLHWVSLTASTVGVLMVLFARGHYMVDVLIAYFVTTMMFYTYHTLANNESLKSAHAQHTCPQGAPNSIHQMSSLAQGGGASCPFLLPAPCQSCTCAYNYFARCWWFRPFYYFECNVRAPLPCRYNWPFAWPRFFHGKRFERTS